MQLTLHDGFIVQLSMSAFFCLAGNILDWRNWAEWLQQQHSNNRGSWRETKAVTRAAARFHTCLEANATFPNTHTFGSQSSRKLIQIIALTTGIKLQYLTIAADADARSQITVMQQSTASKDLLTHTMITSNCSRGIIAANSNLKLRTEKEL